MIKQVYRSEQMRNFLFSGLRVTIGVSYSSDFFFVPESSNSSCGRLWDCTAQLQKHYLPSQKTVAHIFSSPA